MTLASDKNRAHAAPETTPEITPEVIAEHGLSPAEYDKVLEILEGSTALRDKLERNTRYFRQAMTEAGFDILPGDHPIVPIMLYDAVLSQQFADQLLAEGIYVIGFYFPVVPKGKARIRVQLSAGHETHHLDRAIAAFTKVGRALGVIS